MPIGHWDGADVGLLPALGRMAGVAGVLAIAVFLEGGIASAWSAAFTGGG
jgi:hypothetical protein